MAILTTRFFNITSIHYIKFMIYLNKAIIVVLSKGSKAFQDKPHFFLININHISSMYFSLHFISFLFYLLLLEVISIGLSLTLTPHVQRNFNTLISLTLLVISSLSGVVIRLRIIGSFNRGFITTLAPFTLFI